MKRKWSELNGTQKSLILIGAGIEFALTTAALIDLARRPREGVRGTKPLWLGAFFIQPVGPIAYFLAGRRTPELEFDEEPEMDWDEFSNELSG